VKTLQVALGSRSYPIHVGERLLGRTDLLTPHVAGSQVLLVTNETVGPLYAERLEGALAGYELRRVVLPDGEQYKTMRYLERIFDALVEGGFARDCTVVALGGGVVGDMAGFAAACYQRGVAHIQVPTTLLAQVDSSVGGKTAVNHPLAKNMIGAFHQPSCVLADTTTLATLPARELHAGLAEVVKYGLVRDAGFFDWLETNLEGLLERDPERLAHAILRSCRIKAEVVSADEREGGVRALLNLGHTFGHAIETGVGYGQWLHGEAVAAGICLAAHLSARLGKLAAADAARIERLLGAAELPVRAPASLGVERMLELMAVDKKVKGGQLHLVLLDGIGKGEVCADFDHGALVETLRTCREAA